MAVKSRKAGKSHILKGKSVLLRFLVFLVLAVGLNLLFRIPHASVGFAWFLIDLTVSVSAWLINLVGIKAEVARDVIVLSNQPLLINAECTAIYLMIFFASFILVYPAKLLRKVVGLVVGIPAIFVANTSRLLLTACVVEFRPRYFQYFHDYIWQVAFVIFVVALWWLWIEMVVEYEKKTAFPE